MTGVWRNSVLTIVLVGGLVDAALAQERAGLHHQERPESSPILAQYDFEDSTPSGPDTHWVRQGGGGEVALSRAFRVGGRSSLHITEVPGNRDFAEFLAYFAERREGTVFIQFYLLLTDPEQRFNFGLAGTKWFLSQERHGHAVWLQSDDGVFRHLPNPGNGPRWEQLFAPRPFAWYFVDLMYRVETGTYDLAIYEEGLEEPVVDRRGAQNTNGHDNSSVKYFSLIGDLEDAGRFDFFVDDLLIATDPEVRLEPFVAPGRRGYFVDSMAVGRVVERSPQALEDFLWRAERQLDDMGWDVDSVSEKALDRLENAADAAFRGDQLELAEEIYKRLQGKTQRRARMLLKLADVKHKWGDASGERELRERFYGRLDFERR